MGKISYIHYLRGIAAFFIVAIHYNLFASDNLVLGRVFKYFLLEWTAIFVMISGFLFQHLLNRYEFNKFMLSKLKNVILPYIIISIPAILIYMLGVKKDHVWLDIPELLTHSKTYIVLFFYATGAHLGPLWFIPVLILIFFSSKPLSLIGKNEKLLNLATLLSLVVIVFTARPENDANVFLSYIHFLPVYIVGMFIYSKKNFLIDQNKKYHIFLIFFSAFLICTIFELSASLTILSKIPLFLLLCIVLDRLENKKVQFAFSALADASFAIYFLHGYFVGVARKIIAKYPIQFSDVGGVILTISLALLTALVLVGVCLIMKRVTVHTRMIIGS